MKTQREWMRDLMNSLHEDIDKKYEPEEEIGDEFEPDEEKGPYRLKDLPIYQKMVINGNFLFSSRQVESLEGSPEVVKNFKFPNNDVMSLDGGPRIVKGDFDCSNNSLCTFEGGPEEVNNFFSSGNPVKSLVGSPKLVHGTFHIDRDDYQLAAYDGAPLEAQEVAIPLIGDGSLRVVADHFPVIKETLTLILGKGQYVSNALSLFKIKGLQEVIIEAVENEKAHNVGADILTKYLSMGKKGLMKCQTELIQAGFTNWAKL